MANGHGGYRAPANPAPVSGPGALSRRTDGHPAQVLSAAPDQQYGQMKTQLDAQRLAPMAGQAPLPPAANVPAASPQAPGPQMPAFNGTPLTAPSTRPNEPVTAGAPAGAGPGPEVLSSPGAAGGMAATNGSMTRLLSQFAPTDGSGVVAALLARAQSLGV